MKLLLVAFAAVRLLAAEGFPPDFIPPDTKVVFGLNVPAIVGSTLFKDAGAGASKRGEEWLKMVAITGFDPLHDIDEVLIASPADSEKAATLLVLRGRFDLARMGAGATRYRGVAMLGGGKGNSVLALLDAATAVAGDPAAVRAAIDRRGHGALLDARLAARVQSLREHFDLWGTGERPEGFVAPTGKTEELNSMDRFEFGVRISKGFELGAELHARTPKDAEKLAASVGLVKAMMGAQAPGAPNIDVQVKDGTVKISLVISEEQLRKAIAVQQGTSAPKNAAPVVVGSESAAPAPNSTSGGTAVFVLPGKK